MNNTDCIYYYIDSADTYLLFTGKGIFNTIVVGETAAGDITIKDGSTTIAVLPANIPEGSYRFDCSISNSLSVTTAGASKVTVMWSK